MAGKERIIGASKEAEVSAVPAGRDSRGGTNGEGGGGLPERSGAGHARWGRGVRLYVLVVGVVGAATALRWSLDPLFGEAKQFLVYYPGIAVAALVGGARAGVMATVLSALAVDVFFQEPRGSLGVVGLSDWVALGLFASAGALISWMAERVDRARRREVQAAERERVAEAVREQAALLNLAHDAIIVRGAGDRITFWSAGAEETYGWNREEALGQVSRVLLKTRFPKPLAELSAEVAGKGRWEGELTHTRKDGREIVVASRWALQRRQNGEQSGVLEIDRDITEGKRAEEELRGARSRLEEELKAAVRLRELSTQLINGGGDQELYDQMIETAMVIMGADFASIQRAEEAVDGKGRTLKLLAWKHFAPESARFWQVVGVGSATPCGAALRGGERSIIADVERCEFVAGTPDLEEFRRSGIRSVQSTPLISRSGRFLGMISTHWREPHEPGERELTALDVLARQVADLLERRNQDERLRESEARFRAGFEQGASPMVLTVADGTILRANLAFCRVLGYTEAELRERTFLEITHPEDRAASRAGAERIARGEQTTFRMEKRYLRKDGQTIWGDVSAAAVRDAQGRLLHFVAHVQDITARKQAEANQVLLTDVLRILNRGGELHSLTDEVLRVIRGASGFDAVGLRLRQGEDCPYYEQSGFSQEFLREENFLCAKGPGAALVRDAEGQPVLECTCGLVLSGRTDPKMPCFTQGGSFWTNVSKELLALAPQDDPRENPRNRCIYGGYQSVGLFPVRAGQKIVGLLQLNDRRPGRFTPEMLAFYESLAQNIGLALQRSVAEEEARAVSRELQRTVNIAATGLIRCSRDLCYRSANLAYAKLTGVPVEQIVGRPLVEVMGERAFEIIRPYVERVLSGERVEYEIELPYAAAGAKYIHVAYTPDEDRDGKVVGWVASVTDITEGRRAEEARARLAAIVEWSDDAIVSKTLDGTIQTWNAGAERMFGYRAEEVIGRPVSVLIPPERLGEEARVLAQLRRGEPIKHYETVRLAKDGRRLDVSLTISPVKDSEGRIIGASKIAHDIGDLVRAREVLARDKQELERLVAERTARLREVVGELEHFSYTITHDLKSPLRAMRGFAEIATVMCGEGVRKEVKEALGKISTSAERMDALITDALNYSRSVRQELPLTDVDTGALLRGMLDTYPELQPSKAQIQVEGELPVVLGNEAGLTQCFSNLLGNAVKFVKPGKKPQIRVWAEVLADGHQSGWARIWVEDKGIGISREMLPRVFDMFSRGSRDYEGTGIGLALVRKVAERMGGRAGVESEEGKGSRFWVELKLGEVRVKPERVEVAPAEPGGGTVLYVEDEEGDAMFMQRAFAEKGLGSALRVVGDGRAAIEYLSGAGKYADRQEYPLPSVVLLDLNLPQVPGFGVLKWMRNHPDFARTPVVVFSSSTREDDRVKALELGANEFVGKPSSGLKFGDVVEGLREKWMGAAVV